jgi:hypothetical protein
LTLVFAFNEKTGELIQILTSRWREHQVGWHREMIISGAVRSSIGDAELWIRYKEGDWRLVFLADDFDAWLEQPARKRASVSANEPVFESSMSEPVGREHTEPSEKGVPDCKQRANSANMPYPGDSSAEAATRALLTEMMLQDPENEARRLKQDLRNESEIPGRAFDRIWANCITDTGAVAYKTGGPRGPHTAPRRPR